MLQNSCDSGDGISGDKVDNRYHILTYEEIKKLNSVMKQRIPIAPKPKVAHCVREKRSNDSSEGDSFLDIMERSKGLSENGSQHHETSAHIEYPLIHVQLRQLIKSIREALLSEGFLVRDVRINGGAAAYILDSSADHKYSDIDLIFNVDLSDERIFNRLKSLILATISDLLDKTIKSGSYEFESLTKKNDENMAPNSDEASPDEEGARQAITMNESMLKKYIRKLVRINRPGDQLSDSWSLFSLGYPTESGGMTIEMKFVHRMKRQYEFTVDSFQINLDTLLNFYRKNSIKSLTQSFYPTVVGESACGSYKTALNHLRNRVIFTDKPEEIRGGGLLKYCKLLVDNYRPSKETDIHLMERYMCSRFFIDFPLISSQYSKLTSYLLEHFEEMDCNKIYYLQILYEVVCNSTVCLMTHEYQQTLLLIASLVQQVFCRLNLHKKNVHLSEFSSNSWTIDKIHYGTSHFPKHLNEKFVTNYFQSTRPDDPKTRGCMNENFDPSQTPQRDRRYFDLVKQKKRKHYSNLNRSQFLYKRSQEIIDNDSLPKIDPPVLLSEVDFPKLPLPNP